jgi:hypothetical protein
MYCPQWRAQYHNDFTECSIRRARHLPGTRGPEAEER